MTCWSYRVTAFYLYDVPPKPQSRNDHPDPESSPLPSVSRKFLADQFPEQYSSKSRESNTALQIQRLLSIYGRFGWEHYLQSQVGPHCLLYFRRSTDVHAQLHASEPLTAEEEAFLQNLDPMQRPCP
jgi:hypothetical protein